MRFKHFGWLAFLCVGFAVTIPPLLNFFAPAPCPLRFSDRAGELPPQSMLATAGKANAHPAMARKFSFSCKTCHFAFPYLNATGRSFKEHGYLFSDDDGNTNEDIQNRLKISSILTLEKILPLSVHLSTMPIDVGPSAPGAGDAQYTFRGINEVELLAMGTFFDVGSFQFILGAASDDANGFTPGFMAKIGVHPSPYFNAVAGYGPVLATDPYNTQISADQAISYTDRILLEQTFDAGVGFDDTVPFLNIYGRAGPVYYSGGLSGPGTGPSTAVNPRIGQARLAFDATSDFEIGAFGLGGMNTISGGVDANGNPVGPTWDGSFFRAGLDSNWLTPEYSLTLIGLLAGDQPTGGAFAYNFGASGEFAYLLPSSNGAPFLMPMARLEWLQTGSVGQNTNQVVGVLSLQGFVSLNFRVGIDASMDFINPGDNWRTIFYGNSFF